MRSCAALSRAVLGYAEQAIVSGNLSALLAPRSIALIGVSPDPDIIRGRMLESVLHSEFAGPLYLVSRSHARIGDRACVSEVDALPYGVDLAIITIPAAHVVATMHACARRGVKSVVIISSGFAEDKHGGGGEWQRQLSAIAEKHRIALIGPNAEGFLNSFQPLIATFSPVLRHYEKAALLPDVSAASIAVTSQSGGIGFAFFDRGRVRELPFGFVVSMGNEADIDSLEVMAHVLTDERVGVGLMFVEGFKEPARFAAIARNALALGKPIVVAKMGRSQAGAVAAAAHTSSMAGTYRAYEAMFEHFGVLQGDDLDDTIDLAAACVFCRHKLPRGKRVAVLTPSGGAGIWLTDACANAGLEVPPLHSHTRRAFDALLPSYGSSRNPVDLTAQFILNRGYAQGIEMVLRDEGIDAVLVASSLTRVSAVEHDYERLVSVVRASEKPVMFWSYTRPHPECVRLLAKAGAPLFTSLRGVARSLAALAHYRQVREQRLRARRDPVRDMPSATTSWPSDDEPIWTEYRMAAWLHHYDVTLPGALATTHDEAIRIAQQLDVPVALKVQSAQIPHKSDAGGIRLGLRGAKAVRDGFDAVLKAAHRFAPHATIKGVWVQPMARPGLELILGVQRDPSFGLMMLVGAGGVLVELTNDSVLAPLPGDECDAQQMLFKLAIASRLRGVRGEPARDVEAFASLMLILARMARENEQHIEAIDLNPVILHEQGGGFSVVDALLQRRLVSPAT